MNGVEALIAIRMQNTGYRNPPIPWRRVLRLGFVDYPDTAERNPDFDLRLIAGAGAGGRDRTREFRDRVWRSRNAPHRSSDPIATIWCRGTLLLRHSSALLNVGIVRAGW